MSVIAGTRFGPYEILGPLGAGGMGEVYRARDTRLNRTVAIKVLPHHLAVDPAARARFVREGQTLAALSHPNLVSLYDVGTEGETTFAVMELVDGETLTVKLAQGRPPIRRVVEYAVQIARGLAAAHEKGIVHRDLKPANVIVAGDGRVKILDFGLAKANVSTDSASETAAGTEPGVVMGTVGYMAPEQVRGLASDARTDLFAFGAMLYEIASGSRAFQRPSAAETMAAIVKDEPSPMPADIGLPPALERVIRRCLEKRPEDRYQSAADLAFQLDTLASPSGRAETAPVAVERKRPFGLATAVMFLVGLLGGWLVLARLWPPGASAPAATVARSSIMTYSGRDLSPAISPDGKTIAFVSGRSGTEKIWLRQIVTGEEASLTEGIDHAPRFSPDGGTILFARFERRDWALYRVPILGGQPRKVLDQAIEGDWSPDGTHVVFLRQRVSGEWVIGTATADGSEVRESPTPVLTNLRTPRWSPDGRSIVVIQSGIQATIQDRQLLFDATTLTGRTLEPIEDGGLMSAAAWSGNDALVYAQNADVTSYAPESRIVMQRISGGGQTVAWVPTLITVLDLIGDGSLVIDTSSNRQNLREYDWTTSGLIASRWLTRGTSTDRQPAYSPDGKWLVFSATRGNNLDLWLTSTATGETRRLTDDKAQDWDPVFTHDGKQLLWSSNRSGHFEIWIAESDGRNARQLTHDGSDAENPTATPDGEWIIHGAGAMPTQGVWKIRRDGSQATKLVAGLNAHPELSPDGQYALFHTNVVGNGNVFVIRVSDGQSAGPPIPLTSTLRQTALVSVGRGRWRPDGRAIVFVGADDNGDSCLFEQPFVPGQDTSAARRLLLRSEAGLTVESFGISPDGKHITVSLIEDQFALMRLDGLAGVVRPPRR